MSLSDPIADMLTRVRNAHMAELDVVEMPSSKTKAEIARILKREGFLTDFIVEGGTQKTLRLYLRYDQDRKPIIQGVRRESKQGLRKYSKSDELPRVLGGLGVSIMSTSQGIMTARDAHQKRIGGEILCSVW